MSTQAAKAKITRPGGSGVRAKSSGRGTLARAAPKSSARVAPRQEVTAESCEERNLSSNTAVEGLCGSAEAASDLRLDAEFLDPRVVQDADLALVVAPVARHTFKLCFEVLCEGAAAKVATHYVLLVPRLQNIQRGNPRYCDHSVRVEGSTLRGKPIELLEYDHFMLANVPASAVPNLVVEHTFTVCSVGVRARGSGEPFPLPELVAEERLTALADDVDRSEKMRDVLRGLGLLRAPGERDIAYAARLGRTLRTEFEYDAAATEEFLHLLPTLVFERGGGDSRAFNAGFVYALRACGVPARLCLGVQYGPEVEERHGFFVENRAQSEFFAEGIGWVPCDAVSGVRSTWGSEADRCSFLEWHSATLLRAEAREYSKVLRHSGDLAGRLIAIQKACERRRLPSEAEVDAGDLAVVIEQALGLSYDPARTRLAHAAAICGFSPGARMSPESFIMSYAALELGRCPVHLGAGVDLCATGIVGAKLFESGPCERDVPLDASEVVECAMILCSHGRTADFASSKVSWQSPGDVLPMVAVQYEFFAAPVD